MDERGVELNKARKMVGIVCVMGSMIISSCLVQASVTEDIEDVLIRGSDKGTYLQYSCDLSASDAHKNREDLAKKIISEGEKKSEWEIYPLYDYDVSKYDGEYVSIWHFDDKSVAPYPLRFVYDSFNDPYNFFVYVTFDIDDITKGKIEIISFSNGDHYNDMHFHTEADVNPAEFDVDNISFIIKKDHGFNTDEDAEEASRAVLATAMDEFECFLPEKTEFHLADLGWFSGNSEHVSSNEKSGKEEKNVCAVEGCDKEGTVSIIGLSGETEFYCQDHYEEMEDILGQLLSDYKESGSGYSYDPSDPYYAANDHNHDGKISDDEFQDAMGALLDDLAATYEN